MRFNEKCFYATLAATIKCRNYVLLEPMPNQTIICTTHAPLNAKGTHAPQYRGITQTYALTRNHRIRRSKPVHANRHVCARARTRGEFRE